MSVYCGHLRSHLDALLFEHFFWNDLEMKLKGFTKSEGHQCILIAWTSCLKARLGYVMLLNGVLNNPRADRRTTAGTFHITEDGLSIPRDKRAVPRNAFVNLFKAAMQPPKEMMLLPYTSESSKPAESWVSLLLRPAVCPEVPGYCEAQFMETRFFAPGSLVSNCGR